MSLGWQNSSIFDLGPPKKVFVPKKIGCFSVGGEYLLLSHWRTIAQSVASRRYCIAYVFSSNALSDQVAEWLAAWEASSIPLPLNNFALFRREASSGVGGEPGTLNTMVKSVGPQEQLPVGHRRHRRRLGAITR